MTVSDGDSRSHPEDADLVEAMALAMAERMCDADFDLHRIGAMRDLARAALDAYREAQQ